MKQTKALVVPATKRIGIGVIQKIKQPVSQGIFAHASLNKFHVPPIN
jgi:hypothetical protein